MSEPTSSPGVFSELIKEPLVYVIAVIVGTGGYLMKDTEIGPTWAAGLGLIIFGLLCFLIKLLQSLFDGSFKHKYTHLIDSQTKTINSQNQVIKGLSKNTIAAHDSMTSQPPLHGGYARGNDSTNPTSTTA